MGTSSLTPPYIMLIIGPFHITFTPSGRLYIRHESGEGGEFNLTRFIDHIQAFFDREF